MNKRCQGDRFTFEGKHYYRCRYDHTIVPDEPYDGQPCPHCKRTLQAGNIGEATRVTPATVKVMLTTGFTAELPVDPLKPVFEFHETERGNVWLDNDNQHIAWLRLPGENQWLEISISPDNYPGLNVNTRTLTDDELTAHIHKNCGDWYVRKCNLDGVKFDEGGQVVGDPEPESRDWIVTVEQVVEELSDHDDNDEKPAGIEGLGSTQDYPIYGVPSAEVALDEFHATIPIGMLEDFTFTVKPLEPEAPEQDGS